MDADEAKRLALKYECEPRSRDATLTYWVSQHQALNSVFHANDKLLRQNEYVTRDFEATEERHTEARSIDSLFDGTEVHFLKLDVEGAEYELLKGASRALSTTAIGVARFWLKSNLPVDVYQDVKTGMSVLIKPREPIGGSHSAKVANKDSIIDSASGTFQVAAYLPNEDGTIPVGIAAPCSLRHIKHYRRRVS